MAAPHYTAAHVSTIEAGRRSPSRAALVHFARKLGVEPDELVTGRPRDLEVRLQLRVQEARVALSAGRYEDADYLFRQVGRAASRAGFRRVAARAEEGRGLVAERRRMVDDALERFDAARRMLQQEPATVRADAVTGIARCRLALGDVRGAVHVLESYLLDLREHNLEDPVALVRAYTGLVRAYTHARLFDAAADAARQALALGARVDAAEPVAEMHMEVARELLRLGRIDDALDSLKRAEELFRSLQWKLEVDLAHVARGVILVDQGRLDAAREELLAALDALEETSVVANRARALNELARVERLSGRVRDARELLRTAMDVLGDADPAELAFTHRELALCAVDEDPDEAESHFRSAVELYRRAGQPLLIAVTCRELGDFLRTRGEAERTPEAYREGLVELERGGDAVRAPVLVRYPDARDGAKPA